MKTRKEQVEPDAGGKGKENENQKGFITPDFIQSQGRWLEGDGG